MKIKPVLIAAAAFATGTFLFLQRGVVYSQALAPIDNSAVSFRVEFAVADSAPNVWDGKVTVTGGTLAALRHWRPRPGDKIDGSSFHIASHQGVLFAKRPWEPPHLEMQKPYLLTPGLVVDVIGPNARVQIESKGGSLSFSAATVPFGKPQALLNGKVTVERVPTAQPISNPQWQGDFATLTASPSGELWSAWVAFQNNRNEVVARRFDGRAWQPSQKISEDHSDIFLVKAARDKSGKPWFIWSAQVNGNWDLYARTPGSGVIRLTDASQPDIYHNAAIDSAGNLWVVWQGFRGGKSDIFARLYDGTNWSPEEKVSTSSANDWNPVLATDGAGGVYVGWDTYDKDNYDVFIRKFQNNAWGAPIPVANTPKYEAYLTLACDKNNRLWTAWNESGHQWGKDTGFLPRQQGTALYSWRNVKVAVYDNGQWREPAANFEDTLPARLRGYNDLPVLQHDGAGRVWLFFRHRFLRIQDVPPDTPAHRAVWEIYGVSYEGDRWSAPVTMPFSNGRQDMRTGFASGAPGTLYAAYPTDNRNFEDFLYQRAEVIAARIPSPGPAPAELKLNPRPPVELTTPLIHADETADLKRIRAAVFQSAGRPLKIYRGDTHRHTEFSMDGNNDGSLLDTYRYAMDAASLDYLMVSEHNGAGGPDEDYINWLLQQMADVLTVQGTFLPLYGYERSLNYPNGHRNVIFAARGNPTLPIPVEEQKARIGAKPLYEYLKKYKGIAISHTSASNMGTDWRDNDPEVEPLVEIYQGDRVSNEYEGAPKAAHTANPASAPGGFRPAGYVWNAWAKGYKLGVQVSSDHLSTHISYACTLAAQFTKQALLDAMRARQSYGATDNIILDYQLELAGQRHVQGSIVKGSGSPKLSVSVKGTKPIRQIDIIRNNQFIHAVHPLTQDVSFTFTDAQPLDTESYYYVRVQQVDDQMAWSSPVWMTK